MKRGQKGSICAPNSGIHLVMPGGCNKEQVEPVSETPETSILFPGKQFVFCLPATSLKDVLMVWLGGGLVFFFVLDFLISAAGLCY